MLRTSQRVTLTTSTFVVEPHKTGKMGRVLNGAANFHRISLNVPFFSVCHIFRILICVLFCIQKQPYIVSARIEGMFPWIGGLPWDL